MTFRLTVLGLLTGLVLAPLAVLAPAATAAWTGLMQTHGGKLQACKTPLGDGRQRISIRLDNRNASHTHLGGMSRTRDGRTEHADFRTGAGRLSPTKSLIWQRGDYFSAGMGELSGEGAGGDFEVNRLAQC